MYNLQFITTTLLFTVLIFARTQDPHLPSHYRPVMQFRAFYVFINNIVKFDKKNLKMDSKI